MRKIINGIQPLSFFAKNTILDVWIDSGYVFGLLNSVPYSFVKTFLFIISSIVGFLVCAPMQETFFISGTDLRMDIKLEPHTKNDPRNTMTTKILSLSKLKSFRSWVLAEYKTLKYTETLCLTKSENKIEKSLSELTIVWNIQTFFSKIL